MLFVRISLFIGTKQGPVKCIFEAISAQTS